jgi:hypothetical protein
MRVRALRNFTLDEDRKANDLFEVDDRLGAKLIRTRYVAAVAGVDEDGIPTATDNVMGMLRRETRTTAPIPNPPAGFEPLHPALLPSGELTEELLDTVAGGTVSEEIRVNELVDDTDPNASSPAEERNAAAEDIARTRKVQKATDAATAPTPAKAPKAEADEEAEAETPKKK